MRNQYSVEKLRNVANETKISDPDQTEFLKFLRLVLRGLNCKLKTNLKLN